MRALVYIIIIVIVATGCSCTGINYTHKLDEAQDLLNHNPVEAFNRLSAYDIGEFPDSATMARWALLYSEAMAANRMAAPTDTIINIAIDYYGYHRDMAEYNRALRLKSKLSGTGNADALTTALYVQKEKEFMLYKERVKRQRVIFIGLIVLLIFSGVILWQRQRLKLNKVQNESLIAEASALRNGLIVHQSECSSLESRLSVLLANRFGLIDELCGIYYESQGTKAEKNAIVDKVRSQIKALQADEGIFSEMEKCHEDLLVHLRKELPDIKQEEYRLMVYLASGLSNRTIALLISESIDVAYKRKSRLKAKISASDIPHKEQFLSIF